MCHPKLDWTFLLFEGKRINIESFNFIFIINVYIHDPSY